MKTKSLAQKIKKEKKKRCNEKDLRKNASLKAIITLFHVDQTTTIAKKHEIVLESLKI